MMVLGIAMMVTLDTRLILLDYIYIYTINYKFICMVVG